MERGYCLICGKDIEVQMCCNGYMCGCMGQPVEPPLCSGKCHDVYANKPPIKYEDMSIHQLGAISKEFTGTFRHGVFHGVYEGAKWQKEILNEQTDSFIDILLKQLDVWIEDSITREKLAIDNGSTSQELIELATRITYTQLKNFILDSCKHRK